MLEKATEVQSTPVFEIILEDLKNEIHEIHYAQQSIEKSLYKMQDRTTSEGKISQETPAQSDLQGKFSDLIHTVNSIRVRLQADASKLNQLV